MSQPPDIVARLRLIRSDKIGPVTYAQLIARFGSAAAALDAIPDLARRGGGRPGKLASAAEVEREIDYVAQLGAHYLFRDDEAYPTLLAELDSAPPALIASGDIALLARPMVAMVGARNASAAACRFARQLARDLGETGTVVVSGLARGIDTAAHDGSLETGTVAVIAGGIDIFYPPENEERQRAIAASGLLVAEQPPGTEPRARHFPYRNRIIAGLAAGTVVIEAAPKSGSLITARYAADYGREVMAIPGSPLDPRAQGCNELIRDGATLVQSAEDVLEAIRPPHVGAPSPKPAQKVAEAAEPDEGSRHRVVDLLGPTPVQLDELVRQAEVAMAEVQLVLLELELAGRLARHAGGKVSLVPGAQVTAAPKPPAPPVPSVILPPPAPPYTPPPWYPPIPPTPPPVDPAVIIDDATAQAMDAIGKIEGAMGTVQAESKEAARDASLANIRLHQIATKAAGAENPPVIIPPAPPPAPPPPPPPPPPPGAATRRKRG